MKITRRKWYNIEDASPPDGELVHVWGPHTGEHIAWMLKGVWMSFAHDPFDRNDLTHFHRFPSTEMIK